MSKRAAGEPPRLPYTHGTMRYYLQDTGVDVYMPPGSPVIAVADGQVVYCEGYAGKGSSHTPWVPSKEHPKDTPGCLLLLHDEPFHYGGLELRYSWYAHLSDAFALVRDGIDRPRPVRRGMMIGHSGIARSIPHLHYGMLSNRRQRPGDYLDPLTLATWMQSWGRK